MRYLDSGGLTGARAFAFDEPNYQAGVYWDVLLTGRWFLFGPPGHAGAPQGWSMRPGDTGAAIGVRSPL